MSRSRTLGRALRVVAYTGVGGFLAYQLWASRHGFGASVRTIGVRNAALAGLLAGVGGIPGMVGWWRLLAALETRLSFPVALRVYFVAGLTRYLPGGIWPAVAHAAMARGLRESPIRLAAAFLASQGLAVVAGLGVGLLALPALVAHDPRWWVLLPALLTALVPLARPDLLAWLLRRAQRLLRRSETELVLPNRRALLGATALMAVGWLLSGLHIAVLVVASGADPAAALTVGIGGFALSVVAGVVALILPSGLGVRELVLGLTLATLLSGPALVAVVALSRILITVVDLLSTALVLGVLTLRELTSRDRSTARSTSLPAPAAASERTTHEYLS